MLLCLEGNIPFLLGPFVHLMSVLTILPFYILMHMPILGNPTMVPSLTTLVPVHEASQTTNLIQVGIRSMDVIEKTFMDEEKTFFAHDMVADDYWMDKVIEAMTDNVFITFDLDAFDPSILPSTGTPEPGGLFWYETLEFLKQVFEEKNVVGFDIVELCPNEVDKSSDFLAAKLYYKMLGL